MRSGESTWGQGRLADGQGHHRQGHPGGGGGGYRNKLDRLPSHGLPGWPTVILGVERANDGVPRMARARGGGRRCEARWAFENAGKSDHVRQPTARTSRCTAERPMPPAGGYMKGEKDKKVAGQFRT